MTREKTVQFIALVVCMMFSLLNVLNNDITGTILTSSLMIVNAIAFYSK